MTQVYQGDVAVPVTRVKMLPGVVMQQKTVATDGYNAVVVGFGTRREKNIAKPQLGAMKGLGAFRYVREFRAINEADAKEMAKLVRGNHLSFETFEVGDEVKVTGTSKGKGFQGGVKRHRFAGHKTTHGTKDQVRMPGSIGAGEPQHVFKGTRMAGHMGDQQVTVKNLEIIEVKPEIGEILIKGALPGARHSVLHISGAGELKFTDKAVSTVAEVVADEEVVVEAPVKEVVEEVVVETETPEVVETVEATPEPANSINEQTK